MGEFGFLSSVHEHVRAAARNGEIVDAYRLADDLIAENTRLGMTRRKVVDTVIAAGVVYGASMMLDPRARKLRMQQQTLPPMGMGLAATA